MLRPISAIYKEVFFEYLFVEYLFEYGWKKPKHVGGLPHAVYYCI